MKSNSHKFFYFLKKATQILLSVSVFSFLFSRESSLSPFLIMSYDYVTSVNCSVKIFTYTAERNYVFLLCNGILVLIIKTSGLISKITPAVRFATHNPKGVGVSSNDRIHDHDRDHVEEVVDHGSTSIESANVNVGEVEEAVEVESDRDVEVKDGTDDPSRKEVEDDDDEEGFSTDELNKKCEDFIKKMKQELQGV